MSRTVGGLLIYQQIVMVHVGEVEPIRFESFFFKDTKLLNLRGTDVFFLLHGIHPKTLTSAKAADNYQLLVNRIQILIFLHYFEVAGAHLGG